MVVCLRLLTLQVPAAPFPISSAALCGVSSLMFCKWSMQDGYQQRYYVLKSFEQGAKQLRDYCAKITPPHIMERFMMSAH